ncbi:CocE/NonD family hydrolase [Streptomyces sp. MBT65]|uniref:CocE/NonD family hydrolase n=1 Tax=Streptomyces sp. MBT65 TaxID=1488395 RepID=UPI00190C3CA2|nr:CocE/NonD family hydrolase [Streptomyces sp. MBT65]MBK3573893.1 CocE/NonD family hydrolase [Streptomyces sp. MBT65]
MPTAYEHIGPAPLNESAEQRMVPMRDGAELATDLYIPSSPEPCPAVLFRLPYDKNSRYMLMAQLAPHFTSHGYALVVQDVRGKFRSQGETRPFEHEAEDGYDTIDWITRQPWSDGRVGMCGDSYFGFTQWAAVTTGHPALRAIVPRATSMELAAVVPRWEPRSIVTLYGAEYLADYWAGPDIVSHSIDYDRRPLIDALEEKFAVTGMRSSAFDSCVPHPLALDLYPQGHPLQARPVPTLHGVGWFDNLQTESMRDYSAMAAHSSWGPLTYLFADSVDHENYHLSQAPVTPENDHSVDDAALSRLVARYVEPVLEFFRIFLKEEDSAEQLPRVRWNLGHIGPQTAESWPPPGTRELRLHLASPTRAVLDTDGGTLREQQKRLPETMSWVHDPDDLVPSVIADPFSALREWPDQSRVHSRPDVLTFTSERATAPCDLAGPARVTLTARSTAPCMHLFAKLYDVSPANEARLLLRGQSVIASQDRELPDQVTIDLGHLGYRLRPGHRLRLQLCCSDFPHYVWHPGTDENPWLAAAGRPSTQTLTTGGERASHLSLTTLAEPA